jgi:hypothetical protein
VLGRKVGGGRFDFFTENMLLDNKGDRIPLQPGDQVEYRIEVTPARGPRDTLFRKPGVSETRVVSVVTELEAAKSMFQYSKEIARLKQLKTKQAEVDPDGR